MFQVESRAQMACCRAMLRSSFYDLVVQVAIIRPAHCWKNDASLHAARQGKEAVAYAHPSLKPVLKRTLGVPLFQEQLLRMR